MNLTILGTLYKWNQTVFVCTYCVLECIFKVNNICPTNRGNHFCKASLETQCGLYINLWIIQWVWRLGYRWEQKTQVGEVQYSRCQKALDFMPTGFAFILRAIGSHWLKGVKRNKLLSISGIPGQGVQNCTAWMASNSCILSSVIVA